MINPNIKQGNQAEKSNLNTKLKHYSLAAGAALIMGSPIDAQSAVMQYEGPPINIPNDDGVFIDMENLSGAITNADDAHFMMGNAIVDDPAVINFVSAESDSAAVIANSHTVTDGIKYPVVPIAASNSVTASAEFHKKGVINIYPLDTQYPASLFGNFVSSPEYFGVEFIIEDDRHYGWFQFQSDADGSNAKILAWAYESEPDTPIHIPDYNANIPTLNTWGILILAGLILAESARRIRKKNNKCDDSAEAENF